MFGEMKTKHKTIINKQKGATTNEVSQNRSSVESNTSPLKHSPSKSSSETSQYEGQRVRLEASVLQTSYRRPDNGYHRNKTLKVIELGPIRDLQGNLIFHQFGFYVGKGFERLKLQPNDSVQFNARVKKYTAETGSDVYFRLTHPSKTAKVDAEGRTA